MTEVNTEALIAFRKELHAHPETAMEEKETQRRVREKLRSMGVEKIVEVGGTGLLAVFESKEPGSTVMFRAELDALPIREVNTFEHHSRNEGKGHLCGHDGHTTSLIGLAEVLLAEPPAKGRVTLLFQPAEETGQGAPAVIADPAFDEYAPDWVFAYHNLPGFPKGTVICKTGAFTAAVNSLIFRFKGRTSHAAEPEKGLNPAIAMTEVVQRARELEQRDVNHPEFALITPVYMRLGEKAYGTSPGEGEVHFTLRCWSTRQREALSSRLTDLATVSALKNGLELSVDSTEEFAANENNPLAVSVVEQAAKENSILLGTTPLPFRWGEDFGLFTQRFKGAMFGIGSGEECPALHNPDYDFPDDILPVAVSVFHSISQKING